MLAHMVTLLRDLPRRGKLGIGAVAIAVVAVLAYGIGVSVGRPDYPGEGSAEVGFARDMSTHHAQAVEMGMIAFQKSSRPHIRELARDIALTQQGQIGRMQGWLKIWGISPTTSAPPMAWMPDGQRSLEGNLMPGMATRDEIATLDAATGDQLDILFLQYMVRHHLGGAHMVEGLLAQNPSEPMKDFAERMAFAQEREVAMMQSFLEDLGATTLPD
jgi:uncharacterized protein (DUF305 family)